jgi:hypothetical protein
VPQAFHLRALFGCQHREQFRPNARLQYGVIGFHRCHIGTSRTDRRLIEQVGSDSCLKGRARRHLALAQVPQVCFVRLLDAANRLALCLSRADLIERHRRQRPAKSAAGAVGAAESAAARAASARPSWTTGPAGSASSIRLRHLTAGILSSRMDSGQRQTEDDN